MKKKQVLKITPVLVTLNLLVIFAIIGFYGYRLVKYYRLENAAGEDGMVLLVDEVKKKRSFLDETKGLVLNEEDGSYRYKGEVDDNYIYYSGMYFRILEIDKDGNIKAISEDNVTLMYSGFEKGYEKSYVNKWLNASDADYSGVYEKALKNPDEFLVNSYYCSDVVDSTESITCEENANNYKITLLSLYDYKEAGGKTSFINNGNNFNLGTLNASNTSYYVNDEGDIAVQVNRAVLVRPVVTFKADTELLSGNGTYKKPYRIEKHKVELLEDAYVGSYVLLNNEPYRIVKIQETKVELVKCDVLMKDEKTKYKTSFGGTTSLYDPKVGVGKYLNKTFLNTLELKDSVVKGVYYVGLLTLTNSDYSLVRKTTVKAKVGMLTMGDMFVNEQYNVLTTLRGFETDDIIYALREGGYFFGDALTSKYNVRPALYIKADLEISEGKGTKESPYVLKVKTEEVEQSTSN